MKHSFVSLQETAWFVLLLADIQLGYSVEGTNRIVAYDRQAISESVSIGVGLTLSNHVSQIDDNGRIVFVAPIDIVGAESESALFAWENGQIEELFRSGAAAPSSGVFGLLNQPQPSVSGGVLFLAQLEDTVGGQNENVGLYWYQDNVVKEVVREGQALPVSSAATWSGFGRGSVVNDNGHALLALSFDDSQESDIGLFTWDGSTLSKVVRNGDPVPSNSSIGNTVYSALGFGSHFAFNNQGEVAFEANGNTVYRGMPGSLVEVRHGITSINDIALNDDGLLVFSDAIGVYSNVAGSAEVLTIADPSTPAFQPGDSFSSFTDTRLSPTGAILFKAGLSSSAGFRVGLYLAKDGDIREIFRAAAASEILGLGQRDPASFNEFAIMGTDQVVFEAALRNGNNAIFMGDGITTTRIAQGPILEPFGRPRFPVGKNITDDGKVFFESTSHPVSGVGNRNSLILFTPTPPSFNILSVEIEGADIVFTIQSEVGSTYQLQERTSTMPFEWLDLGAPKNGSGGILEFRYPIVGGAESVLFRIETTSP